MVLSVVLKRKLNQVLAIEGASFPEGVLEEYTSNCPVIPHRRQVRDCGGSTLAEV
ncbi:hypothetical protein QUB80_06015 [Chlorogloeopsis sp. ULAP01]|nr:hypothetical protein [Chlorogloeopsis sp. ULAP01]